MKFLFNKCTFIPAKVLVSKTKNDMRRCPCSLWVDHELLCSQKKINGFSRFYIPRFFRYSEDLKNQLENFLLGIVIK